ncbi:LysM peptidoglycan-binding domain-containing protein [Candidatus Uhrbacteria bacterium]|nr:LysM peptidoglycan-binding domain-containing protein [Candidatus Uhrbacteria bacterium]
MMNVRYTLLSTLVLALGLTAGCGDDPIHTLGPADAGGIVLVEEAISQTKTHVVVPGDSLAKIADQYDSVTFLDLEFQNETALKALYDERCTQLREGYRVRRNGKRYCNDRFPNAWANSLKPGDRIVVPVPSAPEMIHQIIKDAKPPIAFVIDDTGSMSNDRQVVTQWYLSASTQEDKEIVGVFMYADNGVRRYTPEGTEFLTMGQVENTHGALKEARKTRAKTIVLVTDEPGDDWNWSTVGDLPEVVAHCLPDFDQYTCETNLERLVGVTGGQYVRGVH